MEQQSGGLQEEEEGAGGVTTPCAVPANRFSNLLSVVRAGAEKPAPHDTRFALCCKAGVKNAVLLFKMQGPKSLYIALKWKFYRSMNKHTFNSFWGGCRFSTGCFSHCSQVFGSFEIHRESFVLDMGTRVREMLILMFLFK